jgi:hypothetical protein
MNFVSLVIMLFALQGCASTTDDTNGPDSSVSDATPEVGTTIDLDALYEPPSPGPDAGACTDSGAGVYQPNQDGGCVCPPERPMTLELCDPSVNCGACGWGTCFAHCWTCGDDAKTVWVSGCTE